MFHFETIVCVHVQDEVAVTGIFVIHKMYSFKYIKNYSCTFSASSILLGALYDFCQAPHSGWSCGHTHFDYKEPLVDIFQFKLPTYLFSLTNKFATHCPFEWP